MSESYDYTGKIGQLLNLQPVWPMYSFDRPSHIVWNAIASKLHAAGWSDDRIKGWLQSKNTCWALDGELGDALAGIAEAYATKMLR